MEKFKSILIASKSTEIPFVVANLPVTEDGYLLSETAIANIDAELSQNADAASELVTAKETISSMETTIEEIKSQLDAANARATAAETSLAAANARIAELEQKDASMLTGVRADADPEEKTADIDPIKMDFQQKLFAKVANS